MKSDKSSLGVIQRLYAHTPGNSQEKRAFSYFVNRTAVELSGFYSSSFWEKLILQASTAEPSLRHAVIGIGALHEEYVNGNLKYDVDRGKGHVFAVNQYVLFVLDFTASWEPNKSRALSKHVSGAHRLPSS